MTILALAALYLILTSLWGFYSAIKPHRILSKITPQNFGLEYETVVFQTKDNLKLHGWWVPNKTSGAKTIIILHGYPADKGNVLPALLFLAPKYNLFLFDFRYLGQSDGTYSTAGAKEIDDLLSAIEYLKTRDINEVGVWGFSMGGAVALVTAREAPEIKAIVSEAAYARLKLMAYELYRLPLLKYPLGWLTGIWAKAFLGIDLTKIAPVESAKEIILPVLLIHSTNDEVIPFSHALLIKDALKDNKKAEFWFRENLVHGELGQEYEKRIEDFFARNL
ncbi:MAG: alpha/beta fold hydrolase [Candidatus Liptonbacteria bacterium]|nr:alpha/beta fold hydrolase [Candidatus Liptonbacteria bacterium]